MLLVKWIAWVALATDVVATKPVVKILGFHAPAPARDGSANSPTERLQKPLRYEFPFNDDPHMRGLINPAD
jgi:hypothetical protein